MDIQKFIIKLIKKPDVFNEIISVFFNPRKDFVDH